MDFILDVLIPKKQMGKIGLSEALAEWNGEYFSKEVPEFCYESELVFRQNLDPKYYESFVDAEINDYIALTLQEEQLSDLEFLINNGEGDLSKNKLFKFLLKLVELDSFIVMLLREEECVDKIYKVKGKDEMQDIVCDSLNWSSPQGVIITK